MQHLLVGVAERRSPVVLPYLERKFYAIIINFHQKSIKLLPSLGGFIAEEVVGTAVALDGGPPLNSGHVIVT